MQAQQFFSSSISAIFCSHITPRKAALPNLYSTNPLHSSFFIVLSKSTRVKMPNKKPLFAYAEQKKI
ncbi:hypothetical protein EAW55_01860 [Legionella jordanis]|nr:hypothetical protein EAW55_01860 [Legionella jordanis]RMX19103.1 hypothetical protein EAS68_06610 [Legionella jordanis]